MRARKVIRRGEHVPPHIEHVLVCDRAVLQPEDVACVVEGMQAGNPVRPATPHGECELPAVPPRRRAGMDDWKLDIPPSDALHRIANDSRLCLELRIVADMLQLAPAAAIGHEVHTGWLHPVGRRYPELTKLGARKATRIRQVHDTHITRRGTRNEDYPTVSAAHAVAARGDRVD